MAENEDAFAGATASSGEAATNGAASSSDNDATGGGEATTGEAAATTGSEATSSADEAGGAGEQQQQPDAPTEEIGYHAVEKDGQVTAIWEMQGRKHLRTIDPRSRQGQEILRLYTAEHHDESADAPAEAS
jgi:hypothetical protein